MRRLFHPRKGCSYERVRWLIGQADDASERGGFERGIETDDEGEMDLLRGRRSCRQLSSRSRRTVSRSRPNRFDGIVARVQSNGRRSDTRHRTSTTIAANRNRRLAPTSPMPIPGAPAKTTLVPTAMSSTPPIAEPNTKRRRRATVRSSMWPLRERRVCRCRSRRDETKSSGRPDGTTGA